MTYNSINAMASSQSLIARVAAAAAAEGYTGNTVQWAQANIWQIVALPGWADAWDYALGNRNINFNPDTGIRDDVINDSMILAAVQPLIAPPADDTADEPEA